MVRVNRNGKVASNVELKKALNSKGLKETTEWICNSQPTCDHVPMANSSLKNIVYGHFIIHLTNYSGHHQSLVRKELTYVMKHLSYMKPDQAHQHLDAVVTVGDIQFFASG